ncbi:MAG: hypothetical protein WCF36_02820 [Candidatus Nanopelagicales bacterium]
MESNVDMDPTTRHRAQPVRARRLRWTAAAAGAALLLGGCGAADVAQQKAEQAVDAIGGSARAQAEALLDEAVGALPGAQLQVSAENRAAFEDLRTELEQVNSQAVALLVAPQDLSEAALAPLLEQLTALQSSVQERAASLTGISVEEQKAWADLAQSVQATTDQVGSLAALLG